MAPKFASRARQSPFLKYVATEFHTRGTTARAALSGKEGVKQRLDGQGIALPRDIARLEQIDQLTPDMLDGWVALKYAHGHSARGIMLLERIGDALWFDHLRLTAMDLAQIKAAQARIPATFAGRPGWIVEEAIASPLIGRPIPLDYKFYCFRDKIAFMAQMDRNTRPMNVTLLDETFAPLAHLHDYVLLRVKHRPGVAIPPRHGAQLCHWARRLSVMTDAPFVRVDLYDGAAGPIFGEFTFSPGTTHRRWWLYSDAMLDRLDALFQESQAMATPDLGDPPTAKEGAMPDAALYAKLASAFAAGNGAAADRLAEFYADIAADHKGPSRAHALALKRAWALAGQAAQRQNAHALKSRRNFAARHVDDPQMLLRRDDRADDQG